MRRWSIQNSLKCTGYFILDTGLILRSMELFIYIQTCVNVNAYPIKKIDWTTVALVHCCNLNWGLANDNYNLYFLQFLTDSGNLRLLYFHSEAIYSWTIEQIDRDIVLLLNITQIWVITICVVFDHTTVIFISKGKKGLGFKKSLVCKICLDADFASD